MQRRSNFVKHFCALRFLRFLCPCLMLLVGVARAETLEIMARAESFNLLDRRIPVNVIASSAMWGGLAGGAVGGAIIGVQMGMQNGSTYNWVPVLATSVGIGIAAGTIWGFVEALSGPRETLVNGPTGDGMSLQDQRPYDLNRRVAIPFFAGRF